MIKLEHINKTYTLQGRTVDALKDVSIEIERGSIYGIVGQSGAGKSTLVRCINLLERPSSGRVIVDDVDLTQLSNHQLFKARREIGMIFQHFNLLSSRTVFDNVALPLTLAKRQSKTSLKQQVMPLLELTGLTDKAKHYPAQLSGGQKQRVAIARALSSSPKVLLSDEATSALDPKTTESILALLKQVNRELGVTIVMITHEMDVVKSICDQVALLEHGKLIETGEVGNFFASPQSDLGKHFVAQSQKFELPEYLKNKLHDQPGVGRKPLLKLSFLGQHVDEPVISHLARQFNVDVSILQAKVEHIRHTTIGLLLIELLGEETAVRASLDYLKTQPITVEVLGYAE